MVRQFPEDLDGPLRITPSHEDVVVIIGCIDVVAEDVSPAIALVLLNGFKTLSRCPVCQAK